MVRWAIDAYRRLAPVRITDLLLEVDAAPGFTDAFSHLFTGEYLWRKDTAAYGVISLSAGTDPSIACRFYVAIIVGCRS